MNLRSARLQQCLLVLVAAALMLAGAVRAHVHLCFDGSEPPATLHLMHPVGLDHALAHVDHVSSDGHTQGTDLVHDDRNVDPLGEALSKVQTLDLFWLAALVLGFYLLSIQRAQAPQPRLRSRAPLSPPRFWHPLLRAPPALS